MARDHALLKPEALIGKNRGSDGRRRSSLQASIALVSAGVYWNRSRFPRLPVSTNKPSSRTDNLVRRNMSPFLRSISILTSTVPAKRIRPWLDPLYQLPRARRCCETLCQHRRIIQFCTRARKSAKPLARASWPKYGLSSVVSKMMWHPLKFGLREDQRVRNQVCHPTVFCT